MTNNPTIDGVSRVTIEKGFDVVKGIHIPTIKISLSPCRADDNEAWHERDKAGERIRALLDADHIVDSGKMVEAVVERRSDASVNWQVVATEQMGIIEQKQSTIAQLQARVAELESGRGEPVAWMYKREGGEILGQLVQMESDDLKCIRVGKFHDDGTRYMWPREDYIKVTPLFTAQPAPVAMVHPFAERIISKLRRFNECASDFESDGVDIGRHWLDMLTQLGLLNRAQRSPALWEITQQGEDCLDATAALNGERG